LSVKEHFKSLSLEEHFETLSVKQHFETLTSEEHFKSLLVENILKLWSLTSEVCRQPSEEILAFFGFSCLRISSVPFFDYLASSWRKLKAPIIYEKNYLILELTISNVLL
jgi:hypothetical protein